MIKRNNVPVSKIHSYNVSVAMDIGLNAAVLFYNICFWVEENMANERNYIDGKYWTYNTVKAFQCLFPEMTSNQISYALKKLEENGYIESAKLNADPYDRTKYYTVCNVQKWISEISKIDNGKSKNVNNIYNTINTKTNNKQQTDNNNTNNSHQKASANAEVHYKASSKRDIMIPYEYTQEQFGTYIKSKVDKLLKQLSPDTSQEDSQTVSEIITYFYKKYCEFTGERHPLLSDIAYAGIIAKILDPIDEIYDSGYKLNLQAYQALIERFFMTDYGVRLGNDTDYRIGYFFSDKVIRNLFHRELH